MTWSIVARDPSSGQLGIAISSRVIAVGEGRMHPDCVEYAIYELVNGE